LTLVALFIIPLRISAADSGVRSWVDDSTAVSVTAQRRPWLFGRDDVQVGVKIFYVAELGAFEINQVGKRHQYLCLQYRSTATAPILNKSRVLEDFSTLVVWADDQPLSFKRYAQNFGALQLSAGVFKRYVSSVTESYYEVSLTQLAIMAEAKTLRIAAANQPPGQPAYKVSRDEHASFAAFTNEVTEIAKLANPSLNK
jgi:hypothetical protein